MAIDGIHNRQPVYRPVRTRNRKASEFDKIFQSDEATASQQDAALPDHEATNDDEKPKRNRKRSSNHDLSGSIDEHV